MSWKKNFEAATASLVLALQHGASPQRVARAAKAFKFSGVIVGRSTYRERFSKRKTKGSADHSQRSRSNRRKIRRHA